MATRPTPTLTIVCSRKRYFIHAGVSRLSRGFKSEAEATAHLAKNDAFYAYWAGSASVSVDNTTPVIVHV